jgi:hypothetical protein
VPLGTMAKIKFSIGTVREEGIHGSVVYELLG